MRNLLSHKPRNSITIFLVFLMGLTHSISAYSSDHSEALLLATIEHAKETTTQLNALSSSLKSSIAGLAVPEARTSDSIGEHFSRLSRAQVELGIRIQALEAKLQTTNALKTALSLGEGSSVASALDPQPLLKARLAFERKIQESEILLSMAKSIQAEGRESLLRARRTYVSGGANSGNGTTSIKRITNLGLAVAAGIGIGNFFAAKQNANTTKDITVQSRKK